MLLVGGNALFYFKHEAGLLRQDLEASETAQALTILQLINAPARAEDWETVQSKIEHLDQLLVNHTIWLTDPNGNLLSDSQ